MAKRGNKVNKVLPVIKVTQQSCLKVAGLAQTQEYGKRDLQPV